MSAPSCEGRQAPLTLGAAAALVLATIATYGASLHAPFAFDDFDSIVGNASLRHLATAFSPPFALGQTVGGRPILNLSLALNYACGGTGVVGYHLVNVAIHAAAGLVLFGLVRRVAATQSRPDPGLAFPGAFLVALLWLVHPLQTEAVTYVVQRAESLMALFYLLCLYALVRSVTAPSRPARIGWQVVSFFFCLAGMGTKEVMVSAPVVALLLDRTFLAGSLAAALRLRRAFYGALASTWLWLAVLVAGVGGRGGTVGLGVGVGWGQYLVTQGPAFAHYLRLAVWPQRLIFDYGAEWIPLSAAWPSLILVGLVVAAAIWGLWRGTDWGFLLGWILAVLAPTSLLPGVRQVVAEHRVYLALAPGLALVVFGLLRLFPAGTRWVLSGGVAAAVGLLAASVHRNEVYRSGLSLWTDTVAKRPHNAWAHNNLGNALRDAGRGEDAMAEFRRALLLRPDLPEAENNLGNSLQATGRNEEALAHFDRATTLRPSYAEARNGHGVALLALGRTEEAVRDFRAAADLRPEYAEAWFNLGVGFDARNDRPDAIVSYRQALVIDPALVGARLNLANALARNGAAADAEGEYRAVLAEAPALPAAHFNHANALALAGLYPEAEAEYQATLRLQPSHPQARVFLGQLQAFEAQQRRQP